MNRHPFRGLTCGRVLAAALIAAPAAAADYPARPVRMLVGAVPGGGVDITARVLAPRLAEQMKQQFIVENRPGGSGNIALEAVAKSPPDGYTLMMATIGTLAINPALFSNLPFDQIGNCEVGQGGKSVRRAGRLASAKDEG